MPQKNLPSTSMLHRSLSLICGVMPVISAIAASRSLSPIIADLRPKVNRAARRIESKTARQTESRPALLAKRGAAYNIKRSLCAYACSGALFVKNSPSSPRSMTMVLPASGLPPMMKRAMGVSTCAWMKRFKGRAPNTLS